MPAKAAPRVALPVSFLTVLVSLGTASSLAWQPEPLRTHTVAPFQTTRPTATGLIVPSETGAEWASVSMDFTWGNVWAYGFDEYRVDGEWLRSTFSFEQRFGRGVLRMEVPLIGRFGGLMDSSIERFHELTDRGNQLRDMAPRNDVLVFVGKADDSFRLEDSSWGMGDITLAAAWTLCSGDGTAPGLSVEAVATVPTGDPHELTGLGEPLYGGGFMATKKFGDGPVGLFMGLLYLNTSADKLAGVPIQRQELSGVAGLECRFGSRWSGVLQYLGQSPVMRDMLELSDPMHEWSLGVRRRWKGGSSCELSIIENAGTFGNSTDFGLHAGWRTVF